MQNHTQFYPGGTNQYGKNQSTCRYSLGGINIEFECKVIQDLADYARNGYFNDMSMKGLESNGKYPEQRRPYTDFIKNIADGNYKTIDTFNTAFYDMLEYVKISVPQHLTREI